MPVTSMHFTRNYRRSRKVGYRALEYSRKVALQSVAVLPLTLLGLYV